MKIGKTLLLGLFICIVGATARGQGTTAGKVDLTFNTQPTPSAGPNGPVLSIAPLTNGQVIVAGGFSFFPPAPSGPLVKLNADGTPDNTFTPRPRIGTFTAGVSVNQILPRPDGRYYLHGNFTTVNLMAFTNIAVIDANGMLDTNFVPTGLGDVVGARLAVEPDNKLLLNLHSNLVQRVGTNGTVESSFIAAGLNTISSMAVHTDGNIYLCGFSPGVPPVAVIARYNSAGSPDPTFTPPAFESAPGMGAPVLGPLRLQPDGKALVLGFYTLAGGVQRGGLARLNANGSLDASFVPGANGVGTIYQGQLIGLSDIARLPDGRFIISRHGPFRYGGTYRGGIGRIAATGSLDTGFDPGKGPAGQSFSFSPDGWGISTIAAGPNGEVYAGGTFTNFNGTGRRYLVRLNPGAVSARPTIVSPPESQSVTSGVDVVFTVVASGPGPFSYAWKHNGKTIPGATAATLTITNVQLSNVGIYLATVANSAGAVTAAPAILTVNGVSVPDVSGPGFKITSPAGTFVRATSNSFTFTGTASDNLGLAALCYQHDSEPWVQVPLMTNWSFTVTLHPGTNLFRVKATDIAGNNSATQRVTAFYVVTQALAVKVVGSGMVSGATNGQGFEIGRNYALTATPKPGNLFSNWIVTTELGVRTVTTPAISVFMLSNATVCANFVTNPFITLQGVYGGLHHEESEASWDRSGAFSLKLGPNGAYSGKLWLGGVSHPLSGAFDLALASKKLIPRKQTNELLVCLQLTGGADYVEGSVSNAAFQSQLFGFRAAFSAANPANTLAGKYTVLFSGGPDAMTSPFGHGYATLAVANNGNVTLKGVLADGTAIAQAMPLAANGQFAFHQPLYKARGSILGWLGLTNEPDTDVTGNLLWTKTTAAAGIYYPAGFTNEVESLGSRYSSTNKPALNFSNASVRLEGGNLSSPLTNEVVLSSANKVSVSAAHTNKLALTVSASSGTLAGGFTHPDTGKKSALKGVVLQKQNAGGGFFLGTNQSGEVYFGLPEEFPLFDP
jgi:uncharacterized delta-60 repeat protein